MKPASRQGGGSKPEHMPTNKYGSRNPTSRVERLLRERELRKFNRTIQLNDDAGDSAWDGGFSEHERGRDDSGDWVTVGEDELLDVAAASMRAASEVFDDQDGGLFKQRLLVVANRLPVSAVRRAEDSWSLEISAGGLVSALLGWWQNILRLFFVACTILSSFAI